MDTIKIICGSENGIGLSEVSNHHLKKKHTFVHGGIEYNRWFV